MARRFTTTGIVLRRTEYGDFDLILTLLSPDRGKMAAIAKGARKSRRRFAGTLELFSVIEMVCSRGKGLPVLQEASVREPFGGIRAEIGKTALASYWAELIDRRVEEDRRPEPLFALLREALARLETGEMVDEVLSLAFQMRFLAAAGLAPNLDCCTGCRTVVERMPAGRLNVDLRRGGLACPRCGRSGGAGVQLERGTAKRLQWLASGPLAKAARIRLTEAAMHEARRFVEDFVCYHFELEPRSLDFLRQLRGERDTQREGARTRTCRLLT